MAALGNMDVNILQSEKIKYYFRTNDRLFQTTFIGKNIMTCFLKICLPITILSDLTHTEISIAKKFDTNLYQQRSILSWNIKSLNVNFLQTTFRKISDKQSPQMIIIDEGYDGSIYAQLNGSCTGFWIVWRQRSITLLPVKMSEPVFSFALM
ncbi:hypothetical protein ACJIZ3_023664 [Penstemon smallii]|uniref:Uncharacterized protein n=1 Tax=Penstemon smallii TaxID=265156 RepID=A0ABD3TSM3_9LAMI